MKAGYIWLLLLSAPWVFSQTFANGVLYGTVTFGDLVVWREVVLTQGSYSLTIDYSRAPVLVTLRSARGRKTVVTPDSILAGFESGHNQVCLVYEENRWHVRSLDLPDLGISLRYSPGNQPRNGEHSKCIPIQMKNPGGA